MSESLRIAGALAAVAGLLLGCCLVPLALCRFGHPALGMVASLFAIRLWTWTIRPMPGFVQGSISLSGLGIIVGVAVVCLVRAIQMLMA